MFRLLIALIFGISFLSGPVFGFNGLSCSKCGGNMPLAFMGSGIPETDEWRFKLNYSGMIMDGSLKGSSLLSVDDVHNDYMNAPTSMDMTMANFAFGYSVSPRINLMGMLMNMNKSMAMDMKMMQNGSTMIKTMDMTSSGISDGMVMLKYLLHADNIYRPSAQWSLLLGSSLPFGSIDEKDGNDNLMPYSMQLGSGTPDPFVGIQYGKNLSPFWVGGTVQYKTRLSENSNGYRLGNESSVNLYSMYQVSDSALVEVLLQRKDVGQISGEVDTSFSQSMGKYTSPNWDPQNSDFSSTVASIGFQWKPKERWIIGFDYGIPITQYASGVAMNESQRWVLTAFYELPTSQSKRCKVTP